MSGVSAQCSPLNEATCDKITSVTPDLYEDYLKDEAWSLEQTNRLLEAVHTLGTSWDSVSKELGRGASECSKRYEQVLAVVSPKVKRRKSSGDAGQSDPGTPSKKRRRRTAAEIERGFRCDALNCSKAYGSEGALKMHVKLKHPTITTSTPSPPVNSHGMRQVPKGSPGETSETASTSHTQLSASAPSLLTSQMPTTPVNQQIVTPGPVVPPQLPILARYSDIPLLVMSIGSWQKRSTFCGDTMARFAYEERKFVWEIYNFNALFARMEVLFDSVTSIEYESLPDNIVKLTIEVKSPPSFFEGVIQAHKPTTWRAVSNDFTFGEAYRNNKHTLLLLRVSVNQPLEHLFAVEPRFMQIFKTITPKATRQLPTPIGIASPYNTPHSILSAPILVQPMMPVVSFQPPVNMVFTHNHSTAPSAVPPLVPDTEEYSPTSSIGDFSLNTTISDDERDAGEHKVYTEQYLQLLEGPKKCQCLGPGGCSNPGCVCFKSLEACGEECDCGDCSNPLNEEAALDQSSTPPTPPTPPPRFLPVCYPPQYPSMLSSLNCGETMPFLSTNCQ